MFSKPLTNEEVWALLPLSKKQRELIIKDFIEPGLYDKIEENEWIERGRVYPLDEVQHPRTPPSKPLSPPTPN
jgi:hypothetical protein